MTGQLVNHPPTNKGHQWLLNPDHKAGYFWGGDYVDIG